MALQAAPPKVSFVARYADPSTDPYRGNYNALNAAASTNASAADYIKSLVNTAMPPILLGLSIEQERTVARAFVCPSRFQTSGPSRRDREGRIYAILTEPLYGSMVTVTELQETDFECITAMIPDSIPRARELLANVELLDPVLADDEHVRQVRVRILQPLPQFLFPFVWGRDLTPKQLCLELLRIMEMNDKLHECSELVNWLLVAVTRNEDMKSELARTLFRPIALNSLLGTFIHGILCQALPDRFAGTGSDSSSGPGSSAPTGPRELARMSKVRAECQDEVHTMIRAMRRGNLGLNMSARFLLALTKLYHEPVAGKFYDALASHTEMISVEVDVFAFAKNTIVLERLGRALSTLPKLSSIYMRLLHGGAGIQAAAAMLVFVRQVKRVSWYIKRCPEGDSSDGTIAFNFFGAALQGNLSIETAVVYYSSRADLVSGICRALIGLRNLTDLHLSGVSSDTGKISIAEAESFAEVFQIKSLRNLDLRSLWFTGTAAAPIFIRALAQVALTNLALGCTDVSTALDVMSLLIGRQMQRLELDGLAFMELGSAMAFCRLLASVQKKHLWLKRVTLHADAESEVGGAVCLPSLLGLSAENLSVEMYKTIGASLKNASQLLFMRLNWIGWDPEKEQSVLTILHNCRHCLSLSELSVSRLNSWSIPMDHAAANLMKHCNHIRKIKIEAFNEGRIPHSSPTFLAACRRHSHIEEISFLPTSSWCPRFLAELARITTRNKENREHRIRFETLAADRQGRAAFGRALGKVKDRPHLLFLALTTCKHHIG